MYMTLLMKRLKKITMKTIAYTIMFFFFFYLVFGKNYLAFGKGKKSQVMKRGPKSQLKNIHIAQLQTLFRVPICGTSCG